jgi:hypothetical protein
MGGGKRQDGGDGQESGGGKADNEAEEQCQRAAPTLTKGPIRGLPVRSLASHDHAGKT